MILDENFKKAYTQYVYETESKNSENLINELCSIQESFMESLDIIHDYYFNENLTEANDGKGNPFRIIIDTISQSTAQDNDELMDTLRYNPVASEVEVKKMSDMKFPANIVFLVTQLIKWFGNIIKKGISVLTFILRSLVGLDAKKDELDKEDLKLKLHQSRIIENWKLPVLNTKTGIPKTYKAEMIDPTWLSQNVINASVEPNSNGNTLNEQLTSTEEVGRKILELLQSMGVSPNNDQGQGQGNGQGGSGNGNNGNGQGNGQGGSGNDNGQGQGTMIGTLLNRNNRQNNNDRSENSRNDRNNTERSFRQREERQANNRQSIPIVQIDISRNIQDFKVVFQRFIDLFYNAFGSEGEELFKTDDLVMTLNLFKNEIDLIQKHDEPKKGELQYDVVKLNKDYNNMRVSLDNEFYADNAVNINRVKDHLQRTYVNTENLKKAYMETAERAKSILQIISSKQAVALTNLGISFTYFSSATYQAMINILDVLDPTLAKAESMEKDLTKLRNDFNNVIDTLSKLRIYISKLTNVIYTTPYQSKIDELFMSARYMTMITTSRLTCLTMYLNELRDIRYTVVNVANYGENKSNDKSKLINLNSVL